MGGRPIVRPAALPPGLTALSVSDWHRGEGWEDKQHPALFPQQMPQLSDLQELQLHRAVFHPGVLSVMKRLQRLELHAWLMLLLIGAMTQWLQQTRPLSPFC